MTRVVAIVEGDGEVLALPVLLRRVLEWKGLGDVTLERPIRVRRDRFLNRESEFSRIVQLAARQCPADGLILILLDADDDCPATLAPAIKTRAASFAGHRSVAVVLANREYEAWFIAGAFSLAGSRGLQVDAIPADPEVPRNAKGWLGARMPDRTYREIVDQPAFSARVDLAEVHGRSRSFRKLCSDIEATLSRSAD